MLTLIIPKEACAALCYEMNRMYAKHVMQEQTPLPWEYADLTERQSIATAIDMLLAGRSLHEIHEQWCIARVQQGWGYGSVKNLAAKKTPYLKPWPELTQLERGKDFLMQGLVTSLITVDAPLPR